jgi:hypothetical protein
MLKITVRDSNTTGAPDVLKQSQVARETTTPLQPRRHHAHVCSVVIK